MKRICALLFPLVLFGQNRDIQNVEKFLNNFEPSPHLTAAGELQKLAPVLNAPIVWNYVISKSGATVGGVLPEGQSWGTNQSSLGQPTGSGYETYDGLLTKIPFPGRSETLAEYQYNNFGDVVREVTEGYEIKYSNFDGLGRPRTIEYPFATSNVVYYTDGPLQVVTEIHSGRTVVQKFTEMGLLVYKLSQINGKPAVVTIYEYDELSRLKTVTVDNLEVYSAEYWEITEIPLREIIEGLEYSYEVDESGLVKGLKVGVGESTVDLRYETDALGRVIATDMPGFGPVSIQYDAIGRQTEIRSESGNKPLIVSFAYNPGLEIEKDHVWNRTTIRSKYDAYGLYTFEMVSGPGIQRSERVNITTIHDNDGKGYIYEVLQGGGETIKKMKYNSLGYFMGAANGQFEMMSNETTAHGTPTNFSGDWAATTNFDINHQLTDVTDPAGFTSTFEHDSRSRVKKATLAGGQEYEIQYYEHISTRLGTKITLENGEEIEFGPIRTQLLPVLKDSHGNSIGATRIVSADNPGKTLKVLKTVEGEEFTQTTSLSDNGLASQLQDFAGLNYEIPRDEFGRPSGTAIIAGETIDFSWENALNKLTVTKGEEVMVTYFDAFGQPYRMEQGSDFYEIIRDRDYRPVEIRTSSGNTTFQYSGAILSYVKTPTHGIRFSHHDAKGNPGSIQVTDLNDTGLKRAEISGLNIEYGFHSNGIQASQSILKYGQQISKVGFSNQGELASFKKINFPEITYSTNALGLPKDMTIEGQTYELFGETNNLTWELPGGARVTKNTEGVTKTVFRPESGERRYEFDGNNRVTKVFQNDNPVLDVIYDGLNIDRIVLIEGEVTVLRENGTLTGYTGPDLTGVSTKSSVVKSYGTFGEEGENLTYTDPNGIKATYSGHQSGKVGKIDIENGPSIQYSYDEAGQLTRAQCHNLQVNYSDYEIGIPKTVSWGADGSSGVFDVQHNSDGSLNSVSGSDFLLSIEWEEVLNEKRIKKLTRAGPSFGETLTPSYSSGYKLDGIHISRTTGEEITEAYGIGDGFIPTQLVRNYKGAAAPSFENVLDIQYGHNTQRIESATQTGTDPFNQLLSYDDQGNLTQIQTSNGLATEIGFSFTSNRLLREVQRTSTAGSSTEVNGFDYAGRRTDGSGPVQGRIVYFHHEDHVVAIGVQDLTGGVNWTHALGYGPFGLSFIKDLTGNQNDFYVFPDQVGTPFAFKNAHTGDVFYLPRNPWGDLLATPTNPVYERGYIPNNGFELPSDPIFDYPPFGINGHLTNPTTGLTVMHFRQYHPRLGQFTTPDFVSLDAFDPQTFYGHSAYGLAGGSPMMFYDPNGLNFENVGDGLIRIEFTMDGVKQEIFVDSIIAEQYVRGKIRVGNGYFGPIPGEMSGRELINTIQERRKMFAEAWVERLYPNKQVKITPHYVANIERDALIVVFATSSLPLALHSAMTLGVKGSLMVSGSSALFDAGQQYFVEGRSIEEINLMRSAGSGYLGLITGGLFKMGLSSTNTFVTGGTKTLGFIGSGIGTGYGGYTAYEGFEEGDYGKASFGVLTAALSMTGAYSLVKPKSVKTRLNNLEESAPESAPPGNQYRTHEVPFTPLSKQQRAALNSKLRDRSISKNEYKHLEWDRRFNNRRNRGVDRFWAAERRRLTNGEPGTRNWTKTQIEDILARKRPSFDGETIQGHHKYNAINYPHLADKAWNIYPATRLEHFHRWHGANWQNETSGVPLNILFGEEF